MWSSHMWRAREKTKWRNPFTYSLLEKGGSKLVWLTGWCRKLDSRLELLIPCTNIGDHWKNIQDI